MTRPVRRLVRLLVFAVWYLGTLVRATVAVLREVVTPTYYSRPGVVRIPIRLRGEGRLAVLAHLVTLTPGTVALDEEDGVLSVHALDVTNPQAIAAEVHALEARIEGIMS
jgi:multicomponent Na+:H+ antiporter subunit E